MASCKVYGEKLLPQYKSLSMSSFQFIGSAIGFPIAIMGLSTRRRGLNIRHTLGWLFMASFLLVSIIGGESDSNISCLKSIMDSMEDRLGSLKSSWDFNNLTGQSICEFYGVTCWHYFENKVMNIDLRDMGLAGEFPLGISNCTSLTSLDLSGNNLFGPIPLDISELISYVTLLDLSSNNFSGEIPPGIANLSYLNVLKLDRNQLTGQIPPAIGLLGRLKTFNVANNRLSGPVPNFVGARVNFTVESYANNSGLCGSPLADCKGDHNDHAFFIIGFVVGWSVTAVLAFAVVWFYMPMNWVEKKVMKWRKKKKNEKRRRGKEQSKR